MRRVVIWGLAMVLLVSLVTGCAAAPPAAEPGATAGSAPQAPAFDNSAPVSEQTSTTSGAAGADDLARMIIYTGDLQLVVSDTGVAQDSAIALVTSAGGYLASANSYAYAGGVRRITLSLRVPAAAFNATMEGLRGLALEVTQDSMDSQDVTEEYVDLGSRLTALEAKATRLEELMAQAEDTESVLAVYDQLSQTQMEIEQTKGRMQYLERTSAMATITVELTPDELSQPVEIAGWRPGGTVKRAIEALVSIFQFLVDAAIWIVLVVAPVVGVIGVVIYGVIRLLMLIFGWGKRKRASPPDEVHPEAS